MYNEESDLWNLSSDNLKNIASGKETIETDGFKISFLVILLMVMSFLLLKIVPLLE